MTPIVAILIGAVIGLLISVIVITIYFQRKFEQRDVILRQHDLAIGKHDRYYSILTDKLDLDIAKTWVQNLAYEND